MCIEVGRGVKKKGKEPGGHSYRAQSQITVGEGCPAQQLQVI